MTKVSLVKKNNHIVGVTCDGHTGFGVYGEDIVCASLSSVVQTAVLGLLAVAKVDINLERDDKRGFIKFNVPDNLSEQTQVKVDAILDTMALGISDLNEGFSDFIELEVKNNDVY